MIDCSPQQIIAESLRDCYRFEYPSHYSTTFNSLSKKFTPLYSPRQFQKKSLKKIPSLNLIQTKPVPQTYFYTKIQNRKEVKKQNEVQLAKNTNYNYNIIENKKFQTNYKASIERRPQIYISYKSPSINKANQCQRKYLIVNNEHINTKQTFCASTSVGSRQTSLIISHLQKSRQSDLNAKIISNFNVRDADRNQVQKIKTTKKEPISPLRTLNPKLSESLIDNNQISQEQYSQVIQSYMKKDHIE